MAKTPMMQQYFKIKRQHHDAVLLYRLGDFYECFYDDAKTVAKILGITLTGRGKDENRVPMAGIPHHSLNQYLPKLIKAGYNVAIAEQTQEAEAGKLVEREVATIITPATYTDDNYLNSGENNYVCCVYIPKTKKDPVGIAYADLSTGEFKVIDTSLIATDTRQIIAEILRIKPAELLVQNAHLGYFKQALGGVIVKGVPDFDFSVNDAVRELLQGYKVKSLKGFGIEHLPSGIVAAAVVYRFLLHNRKGNIEHIKQVGVVRTSDVMRLDAQTIKHLELFTPSMPGGVSLIDCIDNCSTAMGKRKLRSWLLAPLLSETQINQRLNYVEMLYNNPVLHSQLLELMADIADLERLLGKIGTKSANPRDLNYLKSSLELAIKLLEVADANKLPVINSTLNIAACQRAIEAIAQTLNTDAPAQINQGEVVNTGVDQQLDELRVLKANAKQMLNQMHKREIEATGITGMKINYNKVFGYYIEIGKAHVSKVPEHYARKQTLVNAERYITQELKEFEEKLLNSEAMILQIEQRIFEELRQRIIDDVVYVQQLADTIATIDVYANFAKLALAKKYSKPTIVADPAQSTQIVEGRHPVVEQMHGVSFVPNDTLFGLDKNRTIIITGPNMSGKSTYIRQTALIFLLAQIGSFVPASSAQIVVADKIFTRIGASDNLSTGESTFMVEMIETANILNNATPSSLIILDEIGRGTSTYDGVAIAWSVAEYITEKIGARTMFATHYHELADMEAKNSLVSNYCVEVLEDSGKVLFMHNIIKGSANKSYGVHVAKIAGLPSQVVKRANKILGSLHKQNNSDLEIDQLSLTESVSTESGDFDWLKTEITELDLANLTPLEALVKLQDVQTKLNES